jgi:hypothetical protein
MIEIVIKLRRRLWPYPPEVNLGTCIVKSVHTTSLEMHEFSGPEEIPLELLQIDAPSNVKIKNIHKIHLTQFPDQDDTPHFGEIKMSVIRFELEFTAPAREGRFHGAINVRQTGVPEELLTIPISARIEGRFVITPSSVVLPRISNGDLTYETKCICRSANGKAFSLGRWLRSFPILHDPTHLSRFGHSGGRGESRARSINCSLRDRRDLGRCSSRRLQRRR